MLRALLCWVLVVVAACTPARREAEGNIVRHVRFEGNEGLLSGQNDYQLRSEMQQRSTGFGVATWPLIYIKNPEVLRNEWLPRDAYRLEVWYAHHGWLDARVVGWELRKVREPQPKRAGVLDIRGLVEPGEPSVVRTLQIEGTSKALTAVVRAVLSGAPIRQGDQFDLELLEQTRELLLQKLKNQAHAYATAELSIEAHPEDNAVDVVFTVDPGPVCRFGPVTVEGNDIIPTVLIEQRLKVTTGEGYKLDDIRSTQQALFEMGTFSVATVQPDLSDRSVTEVPIRVQVTESRFRSLRVGAGASYDGFLFQPRVSTRIRHVNLFRSLVRAELGARAGFAYGVTGSTVTTSLPTYGADLSFTYPRIAQQRVAIELRGEFEQDVFSGLWAYRRPQADLGVQWRYSDRVTLRAGPHVEQYTFISDDADTRPIENAQRRLFGIEGDGELLRYQLTALDQAITWDWRNDKLSTTRGSYYSLAMREAVPLSDAGYFFWRGSGEGRWWLPLKVRRRGSFPVVLAGKLRGTVIVPLGDKDIPVPERAYLGGANSLRGFRPNQVGPYTTLCTVESYETNGSLFGFGGGETESVDRVQLFHLPEGGNLALETSAELRYDWIYGITLATFVDAGVLTPSIFEPAAWLEGFRASAGLGARYDTLVGPFRFDLSFRPLYPEDDGPLRYAGKQCNSIDEEPRVYDFFSNFRGLRGDAHPPFAMVFFLTIGEAF